MCGICGMAPADSSARAPEGGLEAMLARLAHRGPDGEGRWDGPGVSLGHRRLAIIDLTAAADQPHQNEDGTVLSIVNGEIYNHHELRRGLEARGHRFRSRSDAEVLVHLYEEEGPGAAERLEGMFAFGLWDRVRCRLLIGRDRMGEKPLFYHHDSRRLAFASEIGALLALPGVEREPDEEAIDAYLTFRYVPSPATGLRGIHKLPPGHLLVWEKGAASVERYAAPPRAREAREELRAMGMGERELLRPERLRETVARAVVSRLESDVPVGVLLSGGVDSAVVAYEASRAAGSPLKTFTIGFAESDYDESTAAAQLARVLGTRHHAIQVRADLAAELPKMVERYGEPFGDSSAAAVWVLAREVRREVTVAIGGDGGDELFGGYDRHRAIRLASLLRAAGAGAVIPAAAWAAERLRFTRARRDRLSRLERFTRSARLDPREANTAWLTCFTDEWKDFLYTPEFARRLRGAATARSLGRWYEGSGDPLDDVFYADLSQPLADGLLYKVDIAAMASALEVRSPFLEQELVRFAMALPPSRKTGFKTGKKLLRAAYAGLLPDATLRARKAGFGLPVDRWLRGPLRALSHDTLLAGRAVTRGYLRAGAVAELLRAHDSGEANHDDRIWALLCLELWIRGVVEAGASAVDGVQATGATTAGIREARR